MRSAYIVAYDISDPARLRKVFKKMRGWQKASDHVPIMVELDI